MSELVRLQRDGDVATIVFDNGMNALTTAFQQQLRARLAEVRDDRSVRALVLVAEGRAFCVGADLSGIGSAEEGDRRSIGERTAGWMRELANPLIMDIRQSPVPVVSAVNGACAGAGVGLALAADVVVCGRSAYFYLPFIAKLGIVPDLGTTWWMEHLLGRGRATALTLLGDRLPAEKAVEWGLAWACVDDAALRGEATAIAQRLAKLPAHAALETRAVYEAASRHTLPQQLEHEAARQQELLDQPSFAEGVQAFLQKREPRFAGR